MRPVLFIIAVLVCLHLAYGQDYGARVTAPTPMPAATPYPAPTPYPAIAPTSAQIAAAVSTYLTANPPAPGAPGANATTTATATSAVAGLMSPSAVTALAAMPKVYVDGTASSTGRTAARVATSAVDGSFSVTFSTEGFSAASAPKCVAQAQASAGGIANTVNATTLAPTYAGGAWTVSGWVTAPNTQTLLGLTTTAPVKTSPSVTVIVTAIGN